MYLTDKKLALIAKNEKEICLVPKMANRHGLIAGATGTGKTITLKVMAEAFSDMGVPVFLADIKGDLTGMARAGDNNEHVSQRVEKLNLTNFTAKAYPTRLFDVYGKEGIPVRTTISEMGPTLLARIMELNNTQEGILNIVFKIADDQKLLLIDLKDLRALIQHVGENASDYTTTYGNISTASIGSIQRGLLTLQEEGGDVFFGEPNLDLSDLMAIDSDGRGWINVLECNTLFQHPMLYSTFLLWMLSDLYENLPEAGDLDKPKMIFFFDEAHLLFNDAPKALIDKIEQVVRLIRSKGVGVYFITQTPSDVPDSVLGQLGNKVQHALRAFTPNDQKSLKATAKSFRTNPAFDCETVLGELGTGEALVSFLDEEGVPGIVERAFILPPMSIMGPIDAPSIDSLIKSSPLYTKYAVSIDKESAYEELQKLEQQNQAEAELALREAELLKKEEALAKKEAKEEERKQRQYEREVEKADARRKTQISRTINSTLGTFGREVTKNLVRGIFGSLRR